MLTIILVSTFICIAFLVMGVYWLLFRPVSATAQRLHDLDDPRNVGMAQSIEANTMESLAAHTYDPNTKSCKPLKISTASIILRKICSGTRSNSRLPR